MADRLQSENLALIFPKTFKIFHLFMGVLGQEWRAWSTSSRMTCLGDSYAVLRLQTMKTLWATQLWKNVSEKCVKGTCEKFCEKNRAKNSAKKCAKKIAKNRQKNLWQHCEKMCEKSLWKKTLLGPQAEPLLSAKKKFTEFFIFFGPGCLQPFVGGGGGCDSWGPISVALSARAHACVSTPHCQHVSRTRHIYEHVFLHIFWQVLLLLVLALDWSSRGGLW